MKIKIKSDSLRLPLGQSEVCRLATEGVVEEFTHFGPCSGQRFGYELHASFHDSAVSARFARGRLVVRIPAVEIHKWARTDQVGIDARQPLGDGKELRILIEKDFACIDGVTE